MTKLNAFSRLQTIDAFVSPSGSLPSDEISVSRDIWCALLFCTRDSFDARQTRIVVSIAFRTESPHLHQCRQSCRLVWAAPPLESQQHALPFGTVFVSSELRRGNSRESYCSLAPIVPACLSEVVVTIPSVKFLSLEDHSKVYEELFGTPRLLRMGVTVHPDIASQLPVEPHDLSHGSSHLEVAVSEPVSHGLYVPNKTRTLFAYRRPGVQKWLSLTQVVPEKTTITDEDLIIDENFFANAALHSDHRTPIRNPGQGVRTEEGYPASGVSPFSIEPLPTCSIQDVHDSHVIFISTKDMGKLGIFDGDWCVITFSNGESRFVKVMGFDAPKRHCLYASYRLLYNCGPTDRNLVAVSIRVTPCGPRHPAFPVARTVALARIASPLSLDKFGFSSVLKSLKLKLQNSKWLVRTGDVITVVADTRASWRLADSDDDSIIVEDVNETLQRMAVSEKGHLCEAVHFVVSNAEVSLSEWNSLEPGLEVIQPAELGYWIDSSSTRVVQTGTEHRPVPGEPYDSFASHAGLNIKSFSPYFTKLRDLASAVFSRNASSLGLELVILLKGSASPLMNAVVEAVAYDLGFHLMQTSAFDIVGDTEARTQASLRDEFDAAMSCSPCIFFLQDVDGLMQETQPNAEHSIVRTFNEYAENLRLNWQRTGYPVLVIATTSDAERLPASMLASFKHEVEFEVPDDSARLTLLKSLLDKDALTADLSLKETAIQTAAFTDNDIIDLVSQMRLLAAERSLESMSAEARDIMIVLHDCGVALNSNDTDKALDKARSSFSHNIGAPSIPKISWDDIGGLAGVKQDILDTVQLPLQNPALFLDGLKKRSGILLYGPPGTGKTLVAKAIATTCSLNFLSIKGPELLNMYIGESEANVRRVFQQAREAKPCVIFFDEVDSIAPKRGNHGDSGGVMDRIVSQLLAELDGMSSPSAGADVFVIGATNRPDLLDPALLRPGRFDRLLYLGVSNNHEAQLSILKALTRKFHLDPCLDLLDVAGRCPLNYTGADFYALCSDAMLKAMGRKALEVERKLELINDGRLVAVQHYTITPQYYLSELASPSDTDIIVSKVDFEDALRELVPSVCEMEMEHYRDIQKRFNEGFKISPNDI